MLELMEHRTETEAPARVATCECGAALAPSGDCLEIGACTEADTAAARRSVQGGTEKYGPAAWTSMGGVD